MTIPAIPTAYGGVNFRSRLEARWAAMFDLLGWPWEYEPLDLAGYIPDFILPDSGLLIEVKPIVWRPGELSAAAESVRQKIDSAGWAGPSACLGATLLGESYLGLARQSPTAPNNEPDRARRWIGFICKPRFLNAARVGPELWIPHKLKYTPGPTIDEFSDNTLTFAWREAGNIVQWRAVSPR